MKKLTLDYLHSISRDHGGQCLSDTYPGSKQKVRWRCVANHEWEARVSSVTSGTWCRLCAARKNSDAKKIGDDEIQALANSKGGECLTLGNFGNKDTKRRWRCVHGHEWEASLDKVRNDGSWCPTCANDARRHTIEDMRELARLRGGECLSTVY